MKYFKAALNVLGKGLEAACFILTLPIYLFAIFIYPEPEENWLKKLKEKET